MTNDNKWEDVSLKTHNKDIFVLSKLISNIPKPHYNSLRKSLELFKIAKKEKSDCWWDINMKFDGFEPIFKLFTK